MTMRRIEIDVPQETYERLRQWAKATGSNTSQAACGAILIGFQAIQGIGEGAQQAIDEQKTSTAG